MLYSLPVAVVELGIEVLVAPVVDHLALLVVLVPVVVVLVLLLQEELPELRRMVLLRREVH